MFVAHARSVNGGSDSAAYPFPGTAPGMASGVGAASGSAAWHGGFWRSFNKGSEGIGSAPGMYRQAEINDYCAILVHGGR